MVNLFGEKTLAARLFKTTDKISVIPNGVVQLNEHVISFSYSISYMFRLD
jgi:hypothetical protein